MKTKLGRMIPADLASAIRKSPKTAEMWDRLRPSCQKRYAELVRGAKKPETRIRRVKRVLEMAADYHRRHPQGRSSKV